MRFTAPKMDAQDEMAAAIIGEGEAHDDKWSLNELPDAEKLADFWSTVLKEARQDPNWNFADEE